LGRGRGDENVLESIPVDVSNRNGDGLQGGREPIFGKESQQGGPVGREPIQLYAHGQHSFVLRISFATQEYQRGNPTTENDVFHRGKVQKPRSGFNLLELIERKKRAPLAGYDPLQRTEFGIHQVGIRE